MHQLGEVHPRPLWYKMDIHEHKGKSEIKQAVCSVHVYFKNKSVVEVLAIRRLLSRGDACRSGVTVDHSSYYKSQDPPGNGRVV